MKITLFLGAGFSAPFGLPIMDKFGEFVADTPRIEPFRELWKTLSGRSRRANSFIEISRTNLEDILSLTMMTNRLSADREVADQEHSQLLRLIHTVYSTANKVEEYWSQFETVEKLLEPAITGNHELSFVTTNYDISLEVALQRMEMPTNPGFPYERMPDGVRHLYGDGGPPVFKLHGSVNWFEDPEHPGQLLVDDRVVNVDKFRRDDGWWNELPKVCTGDYEIPGEPVIIPPCFLKPDFRDPIQHIWAGAAEALATADRVVFVGYSFPPTDIEMLYFLGGSLVRNSDLREILIMDLKANEIAARLRQNDSKYGRHFRDLLTPQASDWRDSTRSIA